MNEPRLLQVIKNQGQSLAHVLAYQCAEGHSALLAASICFVMREKFSSRGVVPRCTRPFRCNTNSQPWDWIMVADSAELLHYQQRLCADAVIILVSRSGESVELSKLLRR